MNLQEEVMRLLASGMVLLAGSMGVAQPPPSATRVETVAAKADGARHEGVKVHGHWTIDVKNRDGSLASHTEFENALVTPNSGDFVLSTLLGSESVLGGFVIGVDSATPGALCPSHAGSYLSFPTNSCYLAASTDTSTSLAAFSYCGSGVVCFPGMVVSVIPTYYSPSGVALNTSAVQLQGSFSVPVAGPITGVHTYTCQCYANAGVVPTPAQCAADKEPLTWNTLAFTSTTLPTPIGVVAGQYVTVTVQISFS